MSPEIATPAQPAHQPRPISHSWAIGAASALGPEFLSWLLCEAGVTRRQVTFAVAARGWCETPEGIVVQVAKERIAEPRRALADLLRQGDLAAIIAAAFGTCPAGYLSGLNRLGPDAMSDPLAHCRYWTLFAERGHRPKLKIAQHLGLITEEKLAVLFEVDAALLHLPFVNRMTSLEQVREINVALSAIRASSDREDEAALVAAAVHGDENRKVEHFVSAWIKRCRFPPLPFEADEAAGVFPITSAGELSLRGLAYRNCSRGISRLADAICGRSAYVAYEPGGKQTGMAQLFRLTNGSWMVEGVYGVGNSRLTAEVQEPLRMWFSERGVHSLRRPPLPPEWKTALGLVGHREFAEFEPEHDLIAAY
jgi:hypothetical protein